MNKANLFLVTHPDVVIDPKQPVNDWVLSEDGLKRASLLMEELFWNEVDEIYSSTESKARTVAEMAAQHFKKPLFFKDCLVEIDRSSTGFLPYDEFMETVNLFFENHERSCRGWEPAKDALKRVAECVGKIMAENNGKNIALVGHGAAFALLLCYIKNIPPTFDMCQDGVGFISEIDWKNKEIISYWRKYGIT